MGVLQKIFRGLGFAGTGLVLIFSFQNCSDFSVQESVLYEQGLLESRDAYDAANLPKLLESEQLTKWYKTDAPEHKNQNLILGDQWSFVAALDRTATGKILALDSGAGVEEGSVSIADGKIRATRFNTNPAYSQYVEASVPSSGERMVIGVAFGAKKSEITLMVNGQVEKSPSVATGTVLDFSYIGKTFSSAAAGGQLYEYMLYTGDSTLSTGRLKGAELNSLSRYLANLNYVSDVIFDISLLEEDVAPPDDDSVINTNFLLAKAVFDAKCLSCHNASGTSPNLAGLTEAKALANGWVEAGSPTTSKLYYRLTGSSGPGNKNMPIGGSISAEEVQVVSTWILGIK